MIDEAGLRDSESTGPSCPTTGEAWEEVLELMSRLDDAIARWGTAAADGPIPQQQLDRLRTGLRAIGLKADAAFGRAARSDRDHGTEDVADQTGKAIWDTAQQASEVVAPYVSIVFAGLSDIFGKVAERVDGPASAHVGNPVEVASAPPDRS